MKSEHTKGGWTDLRAATLAVALAAASACAFGAWPHDQVDKMDVDPLGRIVADWRGAKPKAPRKVLLFSECFGYNHHGGRCYGDWTFKRAAETSGAWQIVQEKDVRRLGDSAYISGFDAILFNNSTGVSEEMAPGITEALTGFVKGGKGIALVHAGLDAFKDSDRLMEMFGGLFRGHPWHEDGTWKLRNEAGAHPVNAPFLDNGVTFFKQDEIYQFPDFFNRKTCKVLISVDLSDPLTKEAELWWNRRFGPGSTRADHDYAVSWVKKYGMGRVFFTSFGHDRGAFLDRQRLYHMFAGLQYALGDLDDGVAPRECASSGPGEICTPDEVKEGFVPLFNGRDLSGWTLLGKDGGYKVGESGELLYDHLAGSGNLWTDRDYADFTIRFDFLLSSDCNNGLGIRVPFGKHASRDGMEIQMLDDEGAMYTTTFPQLGLYMKSVNMHGSVYGVIPAKRRPNGRSYLKTAGEWNSQEVTVVGSKIKVILNGVTILDDDLSRYPTDGTSADGSKHPGLRNTTGRICWCSHGYPCRWRNIRIKEYK